jgi:hypothetical protein
MILRLSRQAFVFSILLWCLAPKGHAGEKNQDPYAPVYTEPLSAEPLKDPVSRLIEFPFQLIKWPMDQGIIYTENHRLDKKAIWLYEQSVKQGVKPLLGFSDISAIPAYGAELNLLALSKQKEKFPDLFATATILHCPTIFFAVGSEIGAQKIGGTGFHAKGVFGYDRQEKEPFYGIGPDTSMGDSTSYRMETTKVGLEAGYEISPSIDINGGFDYRNVNIFNRAHDGKGDILHVFEGQNIPGVNGNNLLDYSITLQRDTRDSKDDATRGSYQKFLFQFTDNVSGATARYFKYQLDMAKYLQLWSPRRIFVARLFAEHNDEIDHGAIPFYDMAKLGGAGTNTRGSETMRGYVYNRFYGESSLLLNLEYRYTVMEYKDFKLKTAFFSDTGQTFNEIHEFQFKDFRESYGVGFYLSYAKNTLVNFSVAHSNEGTQFYVKNKLAF